MINDEIREITRRFVEVLHPEKVILFGSYAKDTYREDSDYDFYIVMPDETEKLCFVSQKAYHQLYDVNTKKPVDIIVNTAEKFAHRSTMQTIEREVLQTGVVVYG